MLRFAKPPFTFWVYAVEIVITFCVNLLRFALRFYISGNVTFCGPTIRSIHARAIIGRKRGLAGIGTKLLGVKLLNTLQQVSKLTSTN